MVGGCVGPLLVNESGHLYGECLAFGLEPVDEGPLAGEPFASYRKARDHVMRIVAENEGEFPQIPPVEIARADAPVKEITLRGDQVDLTSYPFIQGNPGDAGRYINTRRRLYAAPEIRPQRGHLPVPSARPAGDRSEYRAGPDRLSAPDGRAAAR